MSSIIHFASRTLMKKLRQIVVAFVFGVILAASLSAECSFHKADEVIFFPTNARLSPNQKSWVIPIRGWVFQPKMDSMKRAALLDWAANQLEIPKSDARNAIFQKRARAFLVDNQPNRQILIRIGNRIHLLKKSGANGHFEDQLTLPEEEVRAVASTAAVGGEWLFFQTESCTEDSRVFTGSVQLIRGPGLSVISDIDDTIKISEVGNHRALLENTFLNEYKAVPDMAALYRDWQAKGAVFHYVSGSPWQLFVPLTDFLMTEKFPAGSLSFRFFRLKDRNFFQIFRSTILYKPALIEDLFRKYPQRKFILVGDSGENDPEIYAEIARKMPAQVEHIYIREVNAKANAERYDKTFTGLSSDLWTIFEDARSIIRP